MSINVYLCTTMCIRMCPSHNVTGSTSRTLRKRVMRYWNITETNRCSHYTNCTKTFTRQDMIRSDDSFQVTLACDKYACQHTSCWMSCDLLDWDHFNGTVELQTPLLYRWMKYWKLISIFMFHNKETKSIL